GTLVTLGCSTIAGLGGLGGGIEIGKRAAQKPKAPEQDPKTP
ncbi:unnamed protein product, partial [marine sediment metagenome]